jgi:bacterioferritin-associated ferredoxin
MYVCVCRAVSDSKIRRAVEQGACSMRALKDQLGVGSVCGRCVPEARQLISEHRGQGQVMRLDQLPEMSAAAA